MHIFYKYLEKCLFKHFKSPCWNVQFKYILVLILIFINAKEMLMNKCTCLAEGLSFQILVSQQPMKLKPLHTYNNKPIISTLKYGCPYLLWHI